MNILLEAVKAGFRNVHNRIPKKLSDLTIDVDISKVKTVNKVEPDKDGNVEIDMPEPEIFVATYGVTTFSEIKSANDDGKIIVLYHNKYSNSDDEKYVFIATEIDQYNIYFTTLCYNHTAYISVDNHSNWEYVNEDIFVKANLVTDRTDDVVARSDVYVPNVKSMLNYAMRAPSTAQVGQTIVVKSVDENGKPIEWECVDSLVKYYNISVDDDFNISLDDDTFFDLSIQEMMTRTFCVKNGTYYPMYYGYYMEGETYRGLEVGGEQSIYFIIDCENKQIFID